MLQRFCQSLGRQHMLVEWMAEEAAYGEVVWSWRPLLALRPRRRLKLNRV